jgi:ABC-2 type transport system permease protein
MVLRPGVLDQVSPEYYAKNLSDASIALFGASISSAIGTRKLEIAGLDPEKIRGYMTQVDLKTFKVTEAGERQENGQGLWLPMVLFFLIYFSVSSYGRRVMMALFEEKQNRVVEIVISSVKPFHLMIGKLLGIGAVGLTQFSIWIVSIAAMGLLGRKTFSHWGVQFQGLPVSVMIYFVVFFILGYCLFGTIYATLGAMVKRPEDMMMLQRPLTILNFIPLITVWFVMRDPSSPLAVLLSLIPFFAPTLMMLRIVAISPPAWQVLLAILLMILTLIIAIWVAAKVYRVGILMYGKRPSMEQIGRWLRYA